MIMHTYIGIGVISIGILFVAIGLFGMIKYRDFYKRMTIASVIDTAGFITITIGIIIMKGFGFFSLKVIFILILMLLLNPLSNHSIARSAYLSGYRVGDDDL